MKKITSLLFTLCLLASVNAQLHCTLDSLHRAKVKINSSYLSQLKKTAIDNNQKAKNLIQGTIQLNNNKRALAPNMVHYVIPVVVHVIHKTGENIGTGSNISVNQIRNQIDTLNNYFKHYGIGFCLATKMPDGTSFNGITRQAHALTDYRFNLDNDDVMKLDVFPKENYLNIWVVNSILFDNGSPSEYLGSATGIGSEKNGVIVRHDYFGNYSNCSGCNLNSGAMGKVLVHEMGHLFGLFHTHEKGCLNSNNGCDTTGDLICDTPPMEYQNTNCTNSNTCNESPNYDDPIHNYMGYKEETCMNHFTTEQVKVMHYNIENYFETNIDVTNIMNTVGVGACGKVSALFMTEKDYLCQLGTIKFTALNSGFIYTWKFKNTNNGITYSPASSGNKFIDFNFTTEGVYDVTLTVTDGSGFSITRTRPKLVFVGDCGTTIRSDKGNWYFGEYAGVEFKQFATLPNPKAFLQIPKTINSFEGCIVQNNAKGELLFYGGGKGTNYNSFGQPTRDTFYIYDKTHKRMPNGSVLGTSTSSQGGVVVPYPNQGNKFYLFTTNMQNFNTSPLQNFGLRYSIIDTSLNNGNGDVDTNYKNVPVYPPIGRAYNRLSDSAMITGEGIASIPGCNNNEYFIIVTSVGTKIDTVNFAIKKTDSLFLSRTIEVYKINSSGISHQFQYVMPNVFASYGGITASTDGRMVCVSGLLFEFDRSNGNLKLIKNLQDSAEVDFYHSEFSTNNQYLYIIRHLDLGAGLYEKILRQYDLSTDLNTYTANTLKNNAYSLQNAPDNKMYISQLQDLNLSVINEPNKLNGYSNSNNINYKQDKLNLKVGLVNLFSKGGLPNFIDARPQDSFDVKVFHRIENCKQVYFYTSQCCKSNYVWNFGDGNTGTGKTANHNYTGKSGTYYVTLTIDNLLTYYDTIQFGIQNSAISGSNKTCDTSNLSAYYAINSNIDKYQYYWDITKGEVVKSEKPYTSAFVKWNADSGKVRMIVKDNKGCSDTAYFLNTFSNLIKNNVIAAKSTCNIDSIIGNYPTGGNDTFQFIWYNKLATDNNWTLMSSRTLKDLMPNNTNKTMQYMRVVKSGECLSYSNIINIQPLQVLNTIEKNYLNPTQLCDGYFDGSDLAGNFSTITYQWQKSFDGSNWNNISGKTNYYYGVFINDTIKYFVRRQASYGTCVSYSNVLENNFTKITKQPQDVMICAYGQNFPIKVNYELEYPDGMDFTIEWELKKSKWTAWKKLKILSKNIFDTYSLLDSITVTSYSPTKTDTIRVGDSLRFRFYHNACGYDKFFYSKHITIKKTDSLKILTHPANTTVQFGDIAKLYFTVNNPQVCQFSWEYSTSNNGPWLPVLNLTKDSIDVYTNGCPVNMYYRGKIVHPCTTQFTNVAKITVNNVSNPTFDYWMRDDRMDRGKEPNNVSSSFVTSEDIWIRNYNDGKIQHQDLNTLLDTNWVNVTIRNRQNNPITGAKLRLYWTWGSTNETWTRNWTKNDSNYIKKGNNDSFLMGSEINFVDIDLPTISRNQFYKVVYPWTNFPREGWYDLSNTFNSERINVCLLARIITCNNAPYGMTFAEGSDVIKNIKNNNNIISRNIWTVEFQLPNNENDNKYKDNELIVFNPNLNNGGVILVGSSSDDSTKSDVCIDTEDSLYFTKAEAYVRLPQNLYDVWKTSSNSITGMLYVKDNCFKITSKHACLNAINLPSNSMYLIEYYYGYMDINNRFSNKVFKVSINQKDENDDITGECIYMIRDNPFVNVHKEIIETNTTYSICYWEQDSTWNDSIIYNVTYSLPYKLYKDGVELNQNPYHQYGFKKGEYMVVATDIENNMEFIDNIYVVNDGISVNESTTPIVFPCDSPYYEYEAFDNTHLIYDLYNNLQTPVSGNTYLLDGTNTIYYDIKNNVNACTVDKINIAFDDIPVFPSTPTANLMAQYNLELDTCCFIKVNDLNCYGMPLAQGQSLDVYDMALNYQFTVTIQSYSDTTMGFRFCPPQWDTTAENINDQYKMVYKSSTCEYCRIDFACDNRVIFENATNVNDIKINDIHIYPNPAQNTVNIFIKNKLQLAHIVVYDQLGKQVMKQELNDSQFATLNVSDLVSGVYTVFIPELNYNYKLVLIK